MTDVQRGRLLVAAQFALFAALVWVPGSTDWSLPFAAALQPLSGIAFGAAAWSFWSLGRARAANPVPAPGGDLVVAGAFRLVRHPTYSLLLLAFLLLAGRSQSWVHLGLWLGLLALVNYKARFEERLLAEKFPAYREYAARTGRFLPRLRSSAR